MSHAVTDHDVLFIPYRQSTRWGFCTPDKVIVIPCVYQGVWPFLGDTAIVSLEERYGAINREGKLYIPCSYPSLGEAQKEIYVLDDLFPGDDLPQEQGGATPPPPEDGTIEEYGGVPFVYSNGMFTTQDPAISSQAYESVSYSFSEQQGGPIWVQSGGKWGVISPSGQQIIPFLYEDIEPFDEDHLEYTLVLLNGQWGVINYEHVQYWEE